MKSGFYTTASNNQPSGWTEKFQSTFQSQRVYQKTITVTVCGLLPVWSTTVFWIPVKPLQNAQQIDEMHQKLQPLQPALVNRRGQTILHDNTWPRAVQPTLQKLNELGYEVLPHLPYSPDFLRTDYYFLQATQQLFAEKMLPQAGGKRNAFLEFAESWSTNFYAIKINLFLIGKKCWL